MARGQIPLSTFTPNGSVSDPAGTAADETDGHYIDAGGPAVILRAVLASAGDAATVTVLAGDSPPANAAGQGNLVVVCDDDATEWIGPFESARFSQHDGQIHVDIDDETGVTFTAFQLGARF